MPPTPAPAVVRLTRSRSRVAAAVAEVTSEVTLTATSGETVKRRKVVKKEAVEVKEMEVEPPVNGKKATPRKKAVKAKVEAKAEVKTPPAPCTPPPPMHLPSAISHLTAVDARFGPLFARVPCRPFLAEDPEIDCFRTLVTSIIGQQVSWMAARSITRRFVEHFCGEGSAGERYDGDKGAFPSADQVRKADVAALKGVGCSTRKAEYLIALAQHFTDGTLSPELLLNGSDEQVAEALIAVRGIGRWTVDMFLIFTLRRPDILPVGDLGVQKGLLRWVLAAHGALPASVPKTPKTPKKGQKEPETPTKTLHTPSDYGTLEASASAAPLTATASSATLITTPTASSTNLGSTLTPPAFTSTTPAFGLVTPSKLSLAEPSTPLPSTPAPPPVTPTASTATPNKLPGPAPDSILAPPSEWDAECIARAAPLPDGLSVETLKSRLAGKKAKGGNYLLPAEMEALTEAWRPYRSVGTYYTWSMAGET